MLAQWMIRQTRSRAFEKRKKKYAMPIPLRVPSSKGRVGGSFERPMLGGGRITNNSIFSQALRSREEDFRRLDGERKVTTKKSTTTSSSVSDNKFIQAMQEFRANFESGDWKAITPKNLNDARADLKKDFESISEQTMHKWGNFLYSVVNTTRPDFTVAASATNFGIITLLNTLSEAQKKAMWRLLAAITLVLGNGRNMQASDVLFSLNNTNFNVDDSQKLFENLSQGLEVFYTPEDLTDTLQKIAEGGLEEERLKQLQEKTAKAQIPNTGRPGGKLPIKRVDDMQDELNNKLPPGGVQDIKDPDDLLDLSKTLKNADPAIKTVKFDLPNDKKIRIPNLINQIHNELLNRDFQLSDKLRAQIGPDLDRKQNKKLQSMEKKKERYEIVQSEIKAKTGPDMKSTGTEPLMQIAVEIEKTGKGANFMQEEFDIFGASDSLQDIFDQILNALWSRSLSSGFIENPDPSPLELVKKFGLPSEAKRKDFVKDYEECKELQDFMDQMPAWNKADTKEVFVMTLKLMKASQNFKLEDSDGDVLERDEIIKSLANRAVELSVDNNKPTPVEIRNVFSSVLDQKQQDRLDELEDAMNEITPLRTDFDKEVKDISAETDPKIKAP